MTNNKEDSQQRIQEIFEEYLAARRKNEPSFFTELLMSLAGEPNLSEVEIQEIQREAATSSDSKFHINMHFERRQEKLEFLSRACFSLVKSIFIAVFLTFLLRIVLHFQSENLEIFDPFALIWLILSLASLVFAISFSRSARKYRDLRTRINKEH